MTRGFFLYEPLSHCFVAYIISTNYHAIFIKLKFTRLNWKCALKMSLVQQYSSFKCHIFCIWLILGQRRLWRNDFPCPLAGLCPGYRPFNTCIQTSAMKWNCCLVSFIICCRFITSLLCLLLLCHCEWGESRALPVIVSSYSRCRNRHYVFAAFLAFTSSLLLALAFLPVCVFFRPCWLHVSTSSDE